MSGHSKWSTIKRKKGALDAKRGRIFSRLAKEIMIASRLGGGDPDGNARLRTVLLAARAQNMPKDNVERAIKKGTGDLEGETYDEVRYEGYGPGGIAIIIDTLTDNKNRTVGEVRHVLSKHGGSLAENGAVTWNFDEKGVITVPKDGLSDDEIFEKSVEAGADDVDTDGEDYVVYTEATGLHAVLAEFEKMKITVNEAKLSMVPKNMVSVDGSGAASVMKIMDAIEELDDVQDVYTNADISDEAMAALEE